MALKLLTITEAAHRLGVDDAVVTDMIRGIELRTIDVDGVPHVRESDVVALVTLRRHQDEASDFVETGAYILSAPNPLLSFPRVDLAVEPIERAAFELVERAVCERYRLIPTGFAGRYLTVAMADPFDREARDGVEFITGFEVAPLSATPAAIEAAIAKHYGAVARRGAPSE